MVHAKKDLTHLINYKMSFKKVRLESQKNYLTINIMTTLVDKIERLKDAIILLDHDMGRDDINDTYRSIKDLVKIKYRDIQRKNQGHC